MKTNGLILRGSNGLILIGANGLILIGADGLILRGAIGLILRGANGLILRGATGLTQRGATGLILRGANGFISLCTMLCLHGDKITDPLISVDDVLQRVQYVKEFKGSNVNLPSDTPSWDPRSKPSSNGMVRM